MRKKDSNPTDPIVDLLSGDIPLQAMPQTGNQGSSTLSDINLLDDAPQSKSTNLQQQNLESAYDNSFDPFFEDSQDENSVENPFTDPKNTHDNSFRNYDNRITADNDTDSDIFPDQPMPEFDDLGSLNDHNGENPDSTQTGLKGLYNNVKSKFGVPRYDNIDKNIPSTDQTKHYQLDSENVIEDFGQDHASAPDETITNTSAPSKYDLRTIWNKLLGRKIDANKHELRTIYIMDHHANSPFRFYGNHISTTKYNAFTFLPKFFFEQFSKYANLFFLFTSAIQQVPKVSPTNRFTTIGTLAVVLLVSAIKEMFEDLKRSRADGELNRSRVLILDKVTQEFVEKKWINVKVGDIIKVLNGDPFPADLILLNSSEPDGLCYIETANLDGETNLKIKQAREETEHLLSPRELSSIEGKIIGEAPNSSLYTYEGTLFLNGREIPLSPDQSLLRGASLRNTQWIQGLVIFTGHETKLMRNATAAPIKRTDVERIINLQIVALFGILITLSLVSSLGDVLTLSFNKSSLSYLHLEGNSMTRQFFGDLLTYWILFSNLVPISLFVTVEVIKYYQAWMIASDLDMYHEETDTPTVCRTSSLVEELGQIEYIFSDKTGTLTRNIMEFKSCTIGGRCYTEKIPEDKEATVVDGVEMGFYDFGKLQDDLHQGSNSNVIDEFLTLLSACHTVIPEVQDNGSIKYQAASPDEGALVDGAAMLGYKFTIRKPSSITIDIQGTVKSYELLNICEFNSTRKRMSAIFRCPDGSIRLYIKGADTVIYSRLQEDNPFMEATTRHLEEFAVEGFRTLCLATRVIPEEEYKSWSEIHNKASVSLENRSQKLDDAAELIEKDLFLLGATAIEDKLQDGVPETIHILQEAGIKIWVLTGDRQETAINIGMSCRLLSEEMNLLIVNEETKEDTRHNIEDKLSVLEGNQVSKDDLNSLALIIDGKSLSYALESDLEDDFLTLGVMCKAVICCRVSPLQKALVVKLVKRKKDSLLLAVGDGANDVSMIQAAHVGVGISGMEGMQAARSADFAIGQFKYLRKLLLVHGAWSYQRISLAILYSFYKNIVLYMTQFWYVFTNAFSGQSLVESWTLTSYNVFFTVLPPFVLGIFDQYLTANMLNQYPGLYKLGQKRHFFNVTNFWGWAINGFYQSAVIFVATINIFRYGNVLSGGQVADHWTLGVAVYTASILTSLGKAALVSSQWTKFTLIAIPGSLAIWLVLFPIYGSLAPRSGVSKEYFGIVPVVYGSLTYWMMVLILPVICLSRDLLWKYYKRTWNPEFYHEVQKIQKYQIQDHKPRFTSFQRTIRKVRQVHRMKKQRGYAFSQVEGQENIVRKYDTTKRRGIFGELD
ncbi:hypothetical protein B5S33_g4983 [[Candida] boidinii]|nr:hypothetical protein B5S33_g4983 [[Candida] boidinii]